MKGKSLKNTGVTLGADKKNENQKNAREMDGKKKFGGYLDPKLLPEAPQDFISATIALREFNKGFA